MVKISYNGKEYEVNEDKLMILLSRLSNKDVKKEEIEELMEKFNLYDEYFLANVNKL